MGERGVDLLGICGRGAGRNRIVEVFANFHLDSFILNDEIVHTLISYETYVMMLSNKTYYYCKWHLPWTIFVLPFSWFMFKIQIPNVFKTLITDFHPILYENGELIA